LVVDDQETVADGWAELLRMQGFDARAVYGGAQAIELIATFEPQCVLFDIAMPGMDGLQLAQHMRTVHRDDVVLLAMTGDVDDARAADTFAVVDHYFAKPFDLAELMRILGPMR
jgi:CheY-like chemotaxis protein